MLEVSGSGPCLVVRVDIGVLTYEAMTLQHWRSVVQVLVVRVDIGVVIYEAMIPQYGRSVVQVLVVRANIGVVIYEAITPKCGKLVVQVVGVRVDDRGVVTYEVMHLPYPPPPHCWRSLVQVLVIRVVIGSDNESYDSQRSRLYKTNNLLKQVKILANNNCIASGQNYLLLAKKRKKQQI